jgi:Planctomycete cytochrome C/Ankyrin repeats (3 copies)/Prenyltransferase and squalene oxidase repeat
MRNLVAGGSRTAIALVCAALAAGSVVAGQAPAKVDFGADVQPIFRARCYSCHGPEQQMNRLRLDRRADAMRGGTQTDIGPGNAEGSRLYHRLIGTKFGTQMPPGQPLSANEAAIVKAWIDQGAEWPDELSGEVPTPPVDSGAQQLMTFIRDGDFDAANRTIAANRGIARLRGAGGTTPLMFAALYGDAALVRRVLAAGADPGAANVAGATALMWAVPDVDKMRALLDAGVDANARSGDGRSALHITAAIVGGRPAVQLLLDYGADAWSPVVGDSSLLREAARVNNPEVFRLLVAYGVGNAPPSVYLRTNCFECARTLDASASGPLPRVPPPDTGLRPLLADPAISRTKPVDATTSTPGAIRAAVERSLPLLQRVDIPFIQKTGCVSCHHNSVVSMAVTAARRNGFRVDENIVSEQKRIIAAYLESWRERTLQNMFIAGQADTISYLMFGLGEAGQPPDPATDAQAIWIKRRQLPDGHWPVNTIRPPIESNDIEVTVLSLRTLQLYAPKNDRAAYAEAVGRARNWLAAAKAETTEERAFRVLGLSWAKAEAAVVADAAKELLALQRSDGGWAQLSSMESDAYATGEALVALEKGGIGGAHPAIKRGVDFLLRTQLQDGSWFVKSRSVPIQAYFESGFPHGPDQWISAASTAWAATALAEAK